MKITDSIPSAGQSLTMVFAVMIIVFMFFLIIVGDNGISDLQLMKTEHQSLVAAHADIKRKNLQLYQEIERLKKDPVYIESVARHDLGLVGKKEIVINMSNIPIGTEK